MIFIPEKEKCVIWNDVADGIYILYQYNEKIQFQFVWRKTNTGKLQPYRLELTNFICNCDSLGNNLRSLPILKCACCQCLPELRYNNIIKKWFCMCSSSLICTKNDDKDELNLYMIKEALNNDSLNGENGLFDNPLKAIIYWNQLVINDYKELYDYLKKDFQKELE